MRWWKPGALFSTRRVRAAASPAWTSLGGHSSCLVYATPKEDGSAAEGFQGHQAGWKGPAPRPMFIIGLPFNRKAATPGNGQMTALLAPALSPKLLRRLLPRSRGQQTRRLLSRPRTDPFWRAYASLENLAPCRSGGGCRKGRYPFSEQIWLLPNKCAVTVIPPFQWFASRGPPLWRDRMPGRSRREDRRPFPIRPKS